LAEVEKAKAIARLAEHRVRSRWESRKEAADERRRIAEPLLTLLRIALIATTVGLAACSSARCNRCIQSLPPETAEPLQSQPHEPNRFVVPPPRPF
jgi:hypothetical protein